LFKEKLSKKNSIGYLDTSINYGDSKNIIGK